MNAPVHVSTILDTMHTRHPLTRTLHRTGRIMSDALAYLATKRRTTVTRATFDKLFPGQFAELYRSGYIFDWRDVTDHRFRVGITDNGRRELAWRGIA